LKYSDSGNLLWKIGDFGSSHHIDKVITVDEISGIIPYMAPEILRASGYSKESDIYSMGIIMWELTTGYKPFANVVNNHYLILDICEGNRPEITEDTPEFFANLMKGCWDSDPKKRPVIFQIFESVIWYNYSSTTKFAEQFEQAENKRLELIQLKKLGPEPHAIYTSRPLSVLISKNLKQGVYYYYF
jgi:serine/threonine protein kinase